jgi:hypothetical protein
MNLRVIEDAGTTGRPRSLTDLEFAQRQRELERAQDRMRRCKSLVAAVVADFRQDATLSRTLRKALIERKYVPNDRPINEANSNALTPRIERLH